MGGVGAGREWHRYAAVGRRQRLRRGDVLNRDVPGDRLAVRLGDTRREPDHVRGRGVVVAVRDGSDRPLVDAGVGAGLARCLVRPDARPLVHLGAGVPQVQSIGDGAGDGLVAVEQRHSLGRGRVEQIVRLDEHRGKRQPRVVVGLRTHREAVRVAGRQGLCPVGAVGRGERPAVENALDAGQRPRQRPGHAVLRDPFYARACRLAGLEQLDVARVGGVGARRERHWYAAVRGRQRLRCGDVLDRDGERRRSRGRRGRRCCRVGRHVCPVSAVLAVVTAAAGTAGEGDRRGASAELQ